MQEVIYWLNQYNTLITLLFTGVVAFSTVVYACLTYRLVKETSAMRQIQITPEVDFTVRPQPLHMGLFDACVKNIGQGPASNIRFLIEPISQGPATELILKGLNSNRFISDGINYLSPNQSMVAHLVNMYGDTANKFDVKFNVTVIYSDNNGISFEAIFRIELTEQEGGTYWKGKDHIHELNKHCGNISKYIGVIAKDYVNRNAD